MPETITTVSTSDLTLEHLHHNVEVLGRTNTFQTEDRPVAGQLLRYQRGEPYYLVTLGPAASPVDVDVKADAPLFILDARKQPSTVAHWGQARPVNEPMPGSIVAVEEPS